MSNDIRIAREYPHRRAKVWRALTEPAIMALWGMRPEGFAPVVGTRFKFVGKPNPGWRGYVECEVTEVREPNVLAYSWVGNDGAAPLHVKYTLEEIPGGTRLIVEQVGFTGIGGFLLSKLVMGSGWKKTLGHALPNVLGDMLDDGTLRSGSTLKPMF
jgi:uncharacterized protein YndB with AHSA1/START domain